MTLRHDGLTISQEGRKNKKKGWKGRRVKAGEKVRKKGCNGWEQ
jgi:hypothetical protein